METNYKILDRIYESSKSLVYRGILKTNNQPIIIKILQDDYPTLSELTRYKQEYKITCSLNLLLLLAYQLRGPIQKKYL